MTSPPPLYTDADLYRLLYESHVLDLDVSAVEPGDCACRAEAYRRAARQRRVEYGQVWPEGEIGGCESPYTFGAGLIRLSCSNGDRVVDALNAEGIADGYDLDDEVVRRLVRAAVRERLRPASPATPEEALCFALARGLDMLERGEPIQVVNQAGRALRRTSPSGH